MGSALRTADVVGNAGLQSHLLPQFVRMSPRPEHAHGRQNDGDRGSDLRAAFQDHARSMPMLTAGQTSRRPQGAPA